MQTGSRWTWRHGLAAFLLLALGAFVQFGTVLKTESGNVVHGDATKYVFYAYNLKYHGVFSKTPSFGPYEGTQPQPDKLTLPGYPAFLSLFVDGEPDTTLVRRATLAQATLGTASVLLAFLIGLQCLPLRWAVIPATLTAISPQLAVFSTHLMTETLFAFLMLAAVLASLIAARPGGRIWQAAMAGLLLGLACLVRPQLQAIPFIAVGIAVAVRAPRAYLHRVLVAAMLFLAVVGPWWLRNAGVDRSQGDPDLAVASLYHGSFPGFMYQGDPRTLGYAYRFDPDQETASRDLGFALAHIGRQAAASPGRYAGWYLVGKPLYFMSWGFITGVSDVLIYRVESSPFDHDAVFVAMRTIARLLHWPLMLLTLACMVMALFRSRRFLGADLGRNAIVLLAALWLYLLVLHAIGAPYPRYGMPFRPLAFVLAMVSLRQIWQWTRDRSSALTNDAPRQVLP